MSDTPTLRLPGSLQLRPEPDGGAQVIDDTSFTAARVNRAARILLEALREPRTEQEVVTILAKAAHCSPAEAAAPVARLLADLTAYGWIEGS
ncbi:PqqD family peptide modification chaperone [Streptomyces sp. NPDC013157]|uniref:PqqD family peptide modification chaperone n=1 Tax=Streptomyces sp. NPDC013157 TaxID=3364861 RepID=UPI0036824641